MKINFLKIGLTKYPFNLDYENASFKGFLSKKDEFVFLEANLKAVMPKICDRCGDEIELDFSQEVKLFLSNGAYKNNENELLDVVECYDGHIDLLEILQSEIQLYLSDYFYCDKCNDN